VEEGEDEEEVRRRFPIAPPTMSVSVDRPPRLPSKPGRCRRLAPCCTPASSPYSSPSMKTSRPWHTGRAARSAPGASHPPSSPPTVDEEGQEGMAPGAGATAAPAPAPAPGSALAEVALVVAFAASVSLAPTHRYVHRAWPPLRRTSSM